MGIIHVRNFTNQIIVDGFSDFYHLDNCYSIYYIGRQVPGMFLIKNKVTFSTETSEELFLVFCQHFSYLSIP